MQTQKKMDTKRNDPCGQGAHIKNENSWSVGFLKQTEVVHFKNFKPNSRIE